MRSIIFNHFDLAAGMPPMAAKNRFSPVAKLAVWLCLFAVSCSKVHAVDDELKATQLFDSTRLVEIEIQVDPEDWDTIRIQRRDFMAAMLDPNAKPFSYVKADITIDGKLIPSVGIRKKGFIGSLDDDFPSLKVKFNEYIDQNPIEGLDRLTLNNNKQDPSLLSQYLTYQLFNRAKVAAPRVGFAKVTVNGEYLGVYSNVESVEKPFLRDRFQDGSGVLVEGALADFSPKSLDRFEVKTGKQTKTDQLAIHQLALELDDPDSLTLDELEKRLDIDEFLRFWCLESLIGFWDGYANNQNNYFVYDSPSDKKLHFIPWGADGAWMGVNSPFGGFGQESNAIYANGLVPFHLYQQEGIPERYQQTMTELLKTCWNEKELKTEIARLKELLLPALHERQRGGMIQSTQAIQAFIDTRRAQINRTFEKPLVVPFKARKPMHVETRGTAKGKFATHWQTRRKKGAPSNVASLTIVLDEKPIELENAFAIAEPFQTPFGFGGPGRNGGEPPKSIVLTGIRVDNGKKASLTLMIEPAAIAQRNGKPVRVNGTFSEGESGGGGFFGNFAQIMVQGEMQVAEFGDNRGDPVEGEFEVKLVQIKGGFMER